MPPIRIITGDEIPESFFSPQRAEAPEETVREILHKVRTEGDAALHAFSQAFDGFDPPVLETGADVLEECRAEMEKENPQLYHALCLSRDLGMDFARKQKACFTDFETELSPGLFAGQKNIPVDRAGLYVPAGRFPLLSSVIMCACPAKAAGVPEVILCTPPVKNGNARIPAHKGILAAAAICGVDRVFATGGAQAIAAMAYGTESIPKVGRAFRSAGDFRRIRESGLDSRRSSGAVRTRHRRAGGSPDNGRCVCPCRGGKYAADDAGHAAAGQRRTPQRPRQRFLDYGSGFGNGGGNRQPESA